MRPGKWSLRSLSFETAQWLSRLLPAGQTHLRRLHARCLALKSGFAIVPTLELALVFALAFSSAQLLWKVLPAPESGGADVTLAPEPDAAQPDANRLAGASARVSLDEIKNLFGPATAVERTRKTLMASRETPLDLTLKGVIAYRISGTKLALIADGKKDEAVYALGDTVAGAEIVEIDNRRILLRRNGQTESLTLKVERLKTIDDAEDAIREVGENERVVDKAVFDRETQDLSRLVQQARTAPYTENGRPAGIKVVAIEDGSLFAELGLRADDVIRAVNGAPVRTTEEALQAYESVRFSRSYAIGVVRAGREMTLNYTIQ
jgi:general secretion pathway protein C